MQLPHAAGFVLAEITEDGSCDLGDAIDIIFSKTLPEIDQLRERTTHVTGATQGKYAFLMFTGSDENGEGFSVMVRKTAKQRVWQLAPGKAPHGPIVLFRQGRRLYAAAGTGDISIYQYTSRHTWKMSKENMLGPRGESFDDTPLRPLGAFPIDRGVLLLYDSSYNLPGHGALQIGAALLNRDDLGHVLWRARSDHIARQVPVYNEVITGDDQVMMIGSVINGDWVTAYYQVGSQIQVVQFPQPFANLTVNEDSPMALRRHDANPILHPKESAQNWEAVAVFNPAAIVHDDKIHLFYRAIGPSNMSVIGHAVSDDGVHFDFRRDHPIYVPRIKAEGIGVSAKEHTDMYTSGPGWEGSEDARATIIDGKIYLAYAAYNGYEQARPAITYLPEDHFRNENFAWSHPQLMTPRALQWGAGNKNVSILPEKVNGKYVVFHRIWPDICIDYVDDLEFGEGKRWLVTQDKIKVRGAFWDSHKVGIGATPIKTDHGWLVIYQGVGSQDFSGHYKIGAMLLDLDDPATVVARTPHPILEPAADYELHGCTSGVAYSCGAVVKDETLYVYYGAADTVTCVATAPLQEFLDELRKHSNHTPERKAVAFLRGE